MPQLETHMELVWMPLDKLQEIDFKAEPLRKLLPKWLSAKPVANLFKSVMI